MLKKFSKSLARLSKIITPHGEINTPCFMPIATRAAVKNISVQELEELGAEIILSNTYHLFLRPGMRMMKKYRGLHRFMNWRGPILTDSGGFQIFSLSKHRRIHDRGVRFIDPQNGKEYFFTPESVAKIQREIGSDIQMALDECPGYPCGRNYAKKSMHRTLQWAERSLKSFQKIKSKKKSFIFGIVQGSVFKDLRQECAQKLAKMNFDGYAIGGVAVGEPRKFMRKVLEWTLPHLPEDKPRYLMGVGKPEEIIEAVKQGIDMFDCVIPTREARHGRLYVWKNSKIEYSYSTINIFHSRYLKDVSPINHTNLKKYSRAYLHHLFRTKEGLGYRLATLNNLAFYLELMEKIRRDIKKGVL